MALLLNSKLEIEEFLKTYDPQYDERLVIKYDNERATVIEAGDYVNFDNKFVIYKGFVNKPSDIDKELVCLYRIGRRLYYRKNTKDKLNLNDVKEKDKTSEDKSELLDVTIKENDNELMVICKELLKGMRVNTFKSLFSNPSDFNNIRKEITRGNGNLTWNRFLLLLDLLGFEHGVYAIKKDGSIIGSNADTDKNTKELEENNFEEEEDIDEIEI